MVLLNKILFFFPKTFYGLFIYLSGADPKILRLCGDLEFSEKNKYFGYGISVLLPASLGGISCWFALQTVTDSKITCLSVGLLWFFIILSIDRFLISTLYKSEHNSNNGFYISIFFRLIFAIIVGLTISHPLIMLYFNSSIQEEIETYHKNDYQQKYNLFIKTESEIKKKYQEIKNNLDIKKDCVERIISAEKYGSKEREIFGQNGQSCGFVSMKPDCRASDSNCQIKIEERKNLISEANEADKNKSKELSHIDDEIKKLTVSKNDDYISRTQALERLEEKSSHVYFISRILVIIFLLIDTLFIVIKATLPISSYERKRDLLISLIDLQNKTKIKAYENLSNNEVLTEEMEKVKDSLFREKASRLESIILEHARITINNQKTFNRYLKEYKKHLDKNDTLGKSSFLKDARTVHELYHTVFDNIVEMVKDHINNVRK